MRLLHRHLTARFLAAFLGSLLVLTLVVLAVDMLLHSDEMGVEDGGLMASVQLLGLRTAVLFLPYLIPVASFLAAFLTLGDDDLRTVGFSRQKTAYGRAIAEDLVSGRVDLGNVEAMDDEAAIAELVKLKGIGRWSAECFLLFSYGRPDVWPADDVGLMIGMEKIKGLKTRPDAKRMRKLAAPWSPWRGVAARLLWHVRKLDVVPADRKAGAA